MNAAEQAAHAFCSALFADLDDRLADHQLTILSWHGSPKPTVRWLRGVDPAATASAIREADTRDGRGTAVYLSMAPRYPHAEHQYPDGSSRRGGNEDVSAIVGVWADLDWMSEAHDNGKRLPPDERAVRSILDACGLRPSLVWRSGHGLQAAWLLAEPFIFDDEQDPGAARDRAATAVRNWQLTLASHAHRLGPWQIDSTGDLSRVLRPAGTGNRKIEGDARRVEITDDNASVRYELDDIEAHTAPRRWLERFASMAALPADAAVRDVDLGAVWDVVNSEQYRSRQFLPEWLAMLVENDVVGPSHRLMQVWRKGHDSGDSETDMSLARHTADLGYTERDAVEIIMCWRLHTGRKVDKVDPRRRTDYLIRTVGRAFAEAAAARKRSEELTEWSRRMVEAQGVAPAAAELPDAGVTDEPAAAPSAAAAVTETAPASAAPAPRPEPDAGPISVERAEQAATGVGGTTGLGRAVADELDERVSAVALPEATPDVPRASDPAPDEPAPDEPAPDPPDPLPPPDPDPDSDSAPADAPSAGPDTEQDEQQQDQQQQDQQQQDGSDPDDADPTPERPVTGLSRSRWGTRTTPQDQVLQALSETLLGEAARWAWVWRLQQRGRGAKAERRLVLRYHPKIRWPHGKPPDGYVPGMPFVTGWWPAGAFGKVGGFVRALEQDGRMICEKVKGEDFDKQFGKSLVPLWEPDDSGGSLGNVTRDGLLSYLLDYPPLTDWHEASQQGMPLIMQERPRWTIDTPFRVLVRWSDYGAYVRGHFAITTPPAVLADMAELAGARPARTVTQNGRWKVLRREYLTDDEWRAVLDGGRVAEQQREEHRHGMHVVGDAG